jgi:hypothetical protein
MYTFTRVFRDVAILPACMCLIPYGSSLISLFSTAHHCPHRLTEKSAPRSTHELTRPRRRRKECPRTDYRRFVESFSFRTKSRRHHCSNLDSRFPWPPSSSTRPLPLNPRLHPSRCWQTAEAALYDRQIRLWGLEAQQRCAPSSSYLTVLNVLTLGV